MVGTPVVVLHGVFAEFRRPLTVAEFAHDLTLDLTNALAGETETATDLIEGARNTVLETVAETDDILLTLLQGAEH